MTMNPWPAFLAARKDAILHYVAEGCTFADITHALSLQDAEHTQRIYEATKNEAVPPSKERTVGARPELAASYGDHKRALAAAQLLNSAAAFFASKSAHGMHGAVKRLEGDSGELVIFTRREYREQLLRAVDEPDDPTHQFSPAEKPEISDEAIKKAALAAGAAKFYPDAQSKKPWGEEAFLVTGGFLQRFVRAICANFPADVETIKKAARWQPSAPLDSCTDPYNCARCKAHPAHRQGLHHAGISSSSRKEGGPQ
jgi:hypothetical protein